MQVRSDTAGSGSTLNLQSARYRTLFRELAKRGVQISGRKRAALLWKSWWFTVACQLQSRQYSDVKREHDPTIICGFWRSGTTLLHELLSRDVRFSFPRTYQCMNPALLTAKPPKTIVELQRPMDSMTIRSDSPQEDEFALLALGAPSFYETLVAPRSWSERMRALDHSVWSQEEFDLWRRTFNRILTLLSITDPRPPLLKSPTHAYRLDLLARNFPGAKFIFIVREPEQTFQSNLKLWPALFELYALEPYDADGLAQCIGNTYRLMVDRVTTAVQALSPARFAYIHYDDLTRDTLPLLKRLYSKFDWPLPEELATSTSAALVSVGRYESNRYEPTPAKFRETIDSMTGDYQRLLGALKPFAA